MHQVSPAWIVKGEWKQDIKLCYLRIGIGIGIRHYPLKTVLKEMQYWVPREKAIVKGRPYYWFMMQALSDLG